MAQVKTPWRALGELITQLVYALVLVKKRSLTQVMDYLAERTGFVADTIHRWRQGRLRPSEAALERLVEIGQAEAKLDRTWGESLLQAARHPEAARLVEKWWGPRTARQVRHNLPRPTYSEFIGRQGELARLLQLIGMSDTAGWVIVDGIGGVGKSALVLAAAYHCLQVSQGEISDSALPIFAAIIFVSAKQQFLTADGIWVRSHFPNTLREILREIALVLDLDISRVTPEEQPRMIRQALERQRVLLIVDNLETVLDQERVLAYLYELPISVKVVVTTREQHLYTPIQLEQLPEQDGICLIRHEATNQNVHLTDAEAHRVYATTGGIPAAIVYAVGKLAAGGELESVLARLSHHDGEIARFCFQDSVTSLRGQPAHHLLMAIAIFPRQPLCKLAKQVAGFNGDLQRADDAVTRLQRLSLVRKRDDHFVMLPLTREYTFAELALQPHFETAARQRWVKAYLHFVEEFGGEDWGEWHSRYNQMETEWENLLAAIAWCVEERRYEEVKLFWQALKGFTLIYGYWDDRLALLQWLWQEAERRGDWMTGVEALYQRAWTLIVMGRSEQLVEAEDLLTQAWRLRIHVRPELQSYVADYTAELHVRHKRYAEAFRWLDVSQQLIWRAQIDERVYTRKQLNTLYWRAILHFKCEEYVQAESLFLQVQALGEQIGWKRIVYYAQNYLADIAIGKNEYEQAERLLQEGLQVVERNKDRRRVAFYKRSLANLTVKRNQPELANQWASQALATFERLGMQPEVKEMQEMVDNG
jgi:LuxR family glucitol operon transcriptional activator